ncbi:hypothetical protein TNIN_422321 [Trichonephila inaurata madagascariensis]|uniref:Uncharacterized protein n=1 Tax=Trichonephila inaurata madagascariensis TaxID=2747483 RepID=A0A8X7BPY2_9ARAC|nr:hypothetical protein TNIN_422321 [Trichonephila inaurata madagascariensis]
MFLHVNRSFHWVLLLQRTDNKMYFSRSEHPNIGEQYCFAFHHTPYEDYRGEVVKRLVCLEKGSCRSGKPFFGRDLEELVRVSRMMGSVFQSHFL